jgi:hypothetical protein
LPDETVQAAWAGEYTIVSDCLPANDVLPGDAVQVAAPSRHANFTAIVRDVDVQVVALAYDRSEYAIRFANGCGGVAGHRVFEGDAAGSAAGGVHHERTIVIVVFAGLDGGTGGGLIATQITVVAGSAPPTGGGIEVRRSNGGWGLDERRQPGGAVHEPQHRVAAVVAHPGIPVAPE